MEPMTAAMLASTGLQIGGSILGGISASKSAASARNQQQLTSGNALAAQSNANLMSQIYNQPYLNLGNSALPLYQWLTTGVRPTVSWSDADAAEMARLAANESANMNKYAIASSSTSGNNKYQRINRRYVNESLDEMRRLADLRQRQGQYNALQGITDPMQLVQQNPLYQWQQKQGEKAINRSMAARGMWNSSAATNQLSNFNESLNAQERGRLLSDLGNALNVGRGSLASVGQGASAYGNIAQNAGTAVGNAMQNYGNQQATNFASLSAMPMNALNAYNNQQQNQAYINYLNRQNQPTSDWSSIPAEYRPSYVQN